MSLFDRVTGWVSQLSGAFPSHEGGDIPPPVLLFVDPEPHLLEAHRRMFRLLRPTWTTRFATDAPTALAELAAQPADVLISEVDLPCRDGTDLLTSVQHLFPGVIRIALSSETDPASTSLLRSARSAHQFLVKPCPSETLIACIEHAVELRLLLRHPDLARVVAGLPRLPSLPPVYHDLVAALADARTSVADLGDIIARDVAMTGRVLHLVNSAFFGLPRRITDPREAAVRLGVETLRSLVLFVRLFFAAPDLDLPGFDLDEIWTHSALTGRLARAIVKQEGGSQTAQDVAMTAGLLHDIGKLLLPDLPGYLDRLRPGLTTGALLADLEYQEFATSHAEIGAYLLGLWGFPDDIVEAVALHHRPLRLAPAGFSTVTAVTAANALLDAEAGKPAAVEAAYLDRIGLAGRLAVWQELAAALWQEARAAHGGSPE
ncbi:MAG: response regulator [Candidatus Ozemobacter sibiricus]|jgi:putative nucleotidyltransferase with HDIG domain|uniref:Response regulator n=1 Tax=Candidatus Ozemobacter sibiricus TaxID=2268124 RepID=A0A367ZJH3_9BACT|nr:MAG: response regulator [Candidatus Ozemobacter sibiricus]